MLTTAQDVAAMAGELGTAEGLLRVQREIDLLNVRLQRGYMPFSPDRVSEMRDAIASLGKAIMKMDLIARTMLAEAGISPDYVG